MQLAQRHAFTTQPVAPDVRPSGCDALLQPCYVRVSYLLEGLHLGCLITTADAKTNSSRGSNYTTLMTS